MKLFNYRKGKRLLIFLLMSLWLGFISSNSFAQNQPTNIAGFKADSESLSSVLQRLAKQGDINLTYNASDTAFSRKISFTTAAKSATQILTELLNELNFEFQQVGNHLVILKTNTDFQEDLFEDKSSAALQTTQNNLNHTFRQQDPLFKTDTIIKKVEVPVYHLDTIFINDTVFKEKEVIIRDTVFINTSGRGKRKINISDNVFSNGSSDDPGWHMEFSLSNAMLSYHTVAANDIPITDSVSSLEPLSFFNPGLGLGLKYSSNKFSWLFGINLQNNTHRFNFERNVKSGGFYLQDTVDVFYTVIQNDTTWTYVTDSTWQPLNQTLSAYDQRNQILLLNLSAKFRFDYLQTRDFDLFFQAGGGMTTPLAARGKTIVEDEGYPVVDLTLDNLNTIIWNYQLGTGIKFKLDQGFGFAASLNYVRQVTNLYKNYPTERRLNGLLIDFSVSYKL